MKAVQLSLVFGLCVAACGAAGAQTASRADDIRARSSNMVFRPEDRKLFKTFHPLLHQPDVSIHHAGASPVKPPAAPKKEAAPKAKAKPLRGSL